MVKRFDKEMNNEWQHTVTYSGLPGYIILNLSCVVSVLNLPEHLLALMSYDTQLKMGPPSESLNTDTGDKYKNTGTLFIK